MEAFKESSSSSSHGQLLIELYRRRWGRWILMIAAAFIGVTGTAGPRGDESLLVISLLIILACLAYPLVSALFGGGKKRGGSRAAMMFGFIALALVAIAVGALLLLRRRRTSLAQPLTLDPDRVEALAQQAIRQEVA